MAFADKAALIAHLETVKELGVGNVEIDDDPLPDGRPERVWDIDEQTQRGVTQHAIRVLDETENYGNLVYGTAIQKKDGTWLLFNDLKGKNKGYNDLVNWVEDAARPWHVATEIRYNHARNTARVEVVMKENGFPIRIFLVAFVGGQYRELQIAEGPFPI